MTQSQFKYQQLSAFKFIRLANTRFFCFLDPRP